MAKIAEKKVVITRQALLSVGSKVARKLHGKSEREMAREINEAISTALRNLTSGGSML
jgi:flagellar basal body-associated protein FliL